MEYLAQNILYSWFYLIYTKLLLEKVGYSWEYSGINMAPPLSTWLAAVAAWQAAAAGATQAAVAAWRAAAATRVGVGPGPDLNPSLL